MIVTEQELSICLPSGDLRMVLMQPYVIFDAPPREPYKWKPGAAPSQLDAIRVTLELARGQDAENRNHFTIFPEYSIPGLEGVAIIDETVQAEEWPKETIIIGGVDGLTKKEYEVLCSSGGAQVHEGNAPDRVNNNQWINCCLTWTKDSAGNISRWIQPKIRPADPELKTACKDMFWGSAVNLFTCSYDKDDYPCRFLSLICFDWIGLVDGQPIPEAVLSSLCEMWRGSPKPVHWIFVLQQNPKPNDPTFLTSTYSFLTNAARFTLVERNHSAVILAANAVASNPCKRGNGGFTALVFHPNSPFDCNVCRPTVCMQPEALRGTDILKRCKDVVFREMGACIHSFAVRVPKFVVPDATDRTYPIIEASVHGLTASNDPRLPGASVPASIKWVNDSLDTLSYLSEKAMHGLPLQEPVHQVQIDATAQLRKLEAEELVKRIRGTSWSDPDTLQEEKKRTFDNVDAWDKREEDALEHMMYTLSILGVCHPLEVAESTLHGTLKTPDSLFQVVAVRASTHEECRKHFDRTANFTGPDPAILITLDADNLVPTEEEIRKICYPAEAISIRFKDYQTLIDKCRGAVSETELREVLNDLFEPTDKPII